MSELSNDNIVESQELSLPVTREEPVANDSNDLFGEEDQSTSNQQDDFSPTYSNQINQINQLLRPMKNLKLCTNQPMWNCQKKYLLKRADSAATTTTRKCD